MVELQDEIQTFNRLGLTSCQARLYLALVRSGKSTAGTISKASNVTRQDVYRVMPTLQKLGLVEKAITAPIRFKAIPIEEGLSILMNRRIKETLELQVKTKELIQKFKENKRKATLPEEEPQFMLIPANEAIIERRRKLIENARTSIDTIKSLKRFPRYAYIYAKKVDKALESGVKIRLLIKKPEDAKSFRKIAQAFKKNPSFKIKYILHSPHALVTVYDKKEVLIVTSATAELGKAPTLWSNNPPLVSTINDYFEIMWLTAMESNHQSSPSPNSRNSGSNFP